MQLELGAGEKISSSVIGSFRRSLLLETAFQGEKLCLPSILESNQQSLRSTRSLNASSCPQQK